MMKSGFRLKAAAAVLFISAFLSGCSEQQKEGSYRQISMSQAVNMMQTEEKYLILDVRTEKEYAEGHIPGAICVPNETIEAHAAEALPDKGQIILVYCRSGNRSKQAAAKLAKQGYTEIYEFGGIIDWTGEIEIHP